MGKLNRITFFSIISIVSLFFYSCSQGVSKNNANLTNDMVPRIPIDPNVDIVPRIPIDPNDDIDNIDPVLKMYIKGVKLKLVSLGVSDSSIQKMDNIFIKFADIAETAVGICYHSIDEYGNFIYISSNEITIDKNKWEKINDDNVKLAIIAHEYGHCSWGLDHLDVEDHIMSVAASHKIDDYAWQYFAYQINSVN